MRIVFIGAVEFSRHCLQVVLENKGQVVGVVTVRSAKNNSDFANLTPLAEQYGLPLHYCKNVNDPETLAWIKALAPDVIFCWGFSQLIKAELLALPPLGILGVHPALLPRNRGRHPLIWAKVLGLKESGLTFFRMDEGADSGPILSQARFEIKEDDDAAALYMKIKALAVRQIGQFLPELAAGRARFSEQDHSRANTWRKRSRTDGLIDWRMSTQAVLNLVRALTRPYPGAEFAWKDGFVTVWRAAAYPGAQDQNIEPGKVIAILNGQPVVKCYDGAVVLTQYEPLEEFTLGDYLL